MLRFLRQVRYFTRRRYNTTQQTTHHHVLPGLNSVDPDCLRSSVVDGVTLLLKLDVRDASRDEPWPSLPSPSRPSPSFSSTSFAGLTTTSRMPSACWRRVMAARWRGVSVVDRCRRRKMRPSVRFHSRSAIFFDDVRMCLFHQRRRQNKVATVNDEVYPSVTDMVMINDEGWVHRPVTQSAERDRRKGSTGGSRPLEGTYVEVPRASRSLMVSSSMDLRASTVRWRFANSRSHTDTPAGRITDAPAPGTAENTNGNIISIILQSLV